MCLTITELTIRTCRFPVGEARAEGDRPGFATLYCGEPIDMTREGIGPYCPEHREIAYVAVSKTPRKTNPDPSALPLLAPRTRVPGP
jgi:hypothetical protein